MQTLDDLKVYSLNNMLEFIVRHAFWDFRRSNHACGVFATVPMYVWH